MNRTCLQSLEEAWETCERILSWRLWCYWDCGRKVRIRCQSTGRDDREIVNADGSWRLTRECDGWFRNVLNMEEKSMLMRAYVNKSFLLGLLAGLWLDPCSSRVLQRGEHKRPWLPSLNLPNKTNLWVLDVFCVKTGERREGAGPVSCLPQSECREMSQGVPPAPSRVAAALPFCVQRLSKQLLPFHLGEMLCPR